MSTATSRSAAGIVAEFRATQSRSALIGRPSERPGKNWAGRLLVLFAAYLWLQTLWAVNTDYAFDGAILFSKYVALFWMVSRLVRGVDGLEYVGWAHVLGCLMWGYIAWTTDVRGRFEVPLGPGVDDSNMLGFHLVTGLAFAGMMFIGVPGKRRWIAFASIPLILNTVILTASRSALIGLVAGGLGCLMFGPKKYRVRLALASSLAIPLILLLAQDDIFWQRAGMIPGVTEDQPLDGASTSRIEAFKGEWKMFKDHPMGVGHRGNEVLSPQYVSASVLSREGFRSAHMSIMAVLADQGVPGLLIYVALHIWALRKLLRLRRLDQSGLSTTIGMYRGAIAGGLFAYVVCGLFLNLLKAEVFIWLLGLIVVAERAAASTLSDEQIPRAARV